MSYEQFIRLLQSLLTMISKDNSEESIKKANDILKNLFELVSSSGTADNVTTRAIYYSYVHFESLSANANEFAGIPNQYDRNKAKRQRLSMAIVPHC